ncbi:hypothetical protein EYF80_029797 [Liparis tanakae]|uniref:Uncharacterized protein n=1 Tax=Liparis tanakae TaxID=230148 RepID=A0A4Z2H3S7_9TELE|nr:hypothetical protein EYF80_029797 [Liparis tanakae]
MEDEIEMSLEEFRAWFGEKVKKNKLVSSEVLEKLGVLQSMLERRTKQAGHLLRLFDSVSKCEAVVKKQYSMLGWEYRGVDADNVTTSSENTVPVSPTTNGVTSPLPKQHDSEHLHEASGKNNSIKVRREPVVVMKRLSACQIRSLRRRKPVIRQSVEASSMDSDSDVHWQPSEDSSDCAKQEEEIKSKEEEAFSESLKYWSQKQRKRNSNTSSR